MKRTLFTLLLAVMAITSSAQSKTSDCAQAIDRMCLAFKYMGESILQCASIDDMDKVSYDEAIQKAHLEDIDDSCASYVLTKSDKDKLIKSFGGFVDQMTKKVCQLTDNILPVEEIRKQFDPMVSRFSQLVNKSTTLSQLLENVNTL